MRLLLVLAFLVAPVAASGQAPPDLGPLPEYVEVIQGEGYFGVNFIQSPITIPTLEEHGPVELTSITPLLPEEATFRRASNDEIAAFETRFPELWRDHMTACPGGGCPYKPDSYPHLSGRWRQYIGYILPDGTRGLWVNYYLKDIHHSPSIEGEEPGYSGFVTMPDPVDDGGPAFFKLLYSTERGELEAISFNNSYSWSRL